METNRERFDRFGAAFLNRVPTVTRVTGLSKSRIYALCAEGRLKLVKIGEGARASAITGESLCDFLEEVEERGCA